MKKTSISILKARLSQYLDAVKSGEEVIVTDRGRPVARLTGLEGEGTRTGRVERLVREGRLRTPTHPFPAEERRTRCPKDPAGRSLALILEERAEGL